MDGLQKKKKKKKEQKTNKKEKTACHFPINADE